MFYQGLVGRGQSFYQRHEKYFPASFFVLGVLFDIVTLGNIDDLFNIIQQAVYLFIIATLLNCELLDRAGLLNLSERMARYWRYREIATHFFFGSLLSVYTLFYFKSASLLSSFAFFATLTVLLVINEFQRFQKMGLYTKFALLSLCLTSYFIYLVPTLYGSMGPLSSAAALIFTLVFIYLLSRGQLRRIGNQKVIIQQVILPAILMQGIFLGLYLLRWIPPVPVSIQFMGIYHHIKKVDGNYELAHLRPWWRFWHTGDQLFLARPGDKIFCFARIYSPARFNDKVFVRWFLQLPNQRWYPSDAIPVEIVGGRKAGYRGVTYKANFEPGEWRVQLESKDGREIGRLYFTVENDTSSDPRQYKTVIQ